MKSLMVKPAAFSKLIVIALLGAFLLVLLESRFDHREVLGEAWQPWIPLVYCGIMLVLGPVGLLRWNRGGRPALLVGFAVGLAVGLVGFWFHSDGSPISQLARVLGAWALRPGDNGGVKPQLSGPPALAPLSFVGLGLIGALACSWRSAAEEAQTGARSSNA